jgi:hypothetical protein
MTDAQYLASEDVEALLGNWVGLNAALMELPIEPVRQLLDAEMAGRQRPQLILRLHSRFNKLRAVEERGRILRGERAWRYL